MAASRTPDPHEAGPGTSRRALLVGTAAGAVGLAAATALPAAAAAQHPDRRASFVTVHNGQFWLDGAAFRFGGTNTYYLHQLSHYVIDNALGDAAAMSLPVVRAWAFADGSGHGYTALQPEPFVYDEAAFDSLDYAVFRAGQLGIRLVLALVNNWPDYGGMQQYVQWFLGLPDDTFGDATNHDLFYSTQSIKDCYRAYLRFVTHRRNRYTGLRYNEDPTIMTFELANEPRSRSDKTGVRLLAWITEMSAYLKSLAPRQLVAVGDEGFYGDPTNFDYPYSTFEGDQWKKFVALPGVDYGTAHLYPQSWGENPASKPGTDPIAWGVQWITDHIRDGRALGKPVVIEEYGVAINAAQGVPDVATRDTAYRTWTQAVHDLGGAGDQFWLLTSRVDDGSYYPDFDGYRIYWDNESANPSNTTAQLLSAHAKAMATTP